MSTHYNAFISYKHADLDNKIAAYVEKHLEHFHIPGKIQKKTGVKKIERIFRDTDELPITSDLSGTIEDALKNADYLIVICSPNTCKSMWVEREINFFLQNHPKENILTVLADGEPADVVPEILKNKEVTRVNENGESVTVIEPVEPLSCDFRLPLRVAKNTEIPRLAAALIGCRYNELMDRQRQYKMKRLTAVFAGIMALSIGFGAYMFNSKMQINESYRASLISQSRYLANESEKLFDDEQRIDALHLALAALPSEEMPDRPVTIEAVRAITQATGAYMPQLTTNIAAEWAYELPSTVTELRIDPEHGNFAAMDQEGNIKVWDKDTHKEIYSYSERGVNTCAKYIALYKGNLIVICENSVISIDPRSGKVNWNTGRLEETIECEHPINLTNDDNFIIALYSGKILEISEKDGSVLNTYALPEDVVNEFNRFDITVHRINDLALSKDNTKIAFSYSTNDRNSRQDICGYTNRLGVYDIPSGKTIVDESCFEEIDDLCFSKDGDLYLSVLDDYNTISSNYLNQTTLKNSRQTVCCLSPEDFTVKWAKNFSCSDMIKDSGLIYIEKHNTLSYFAGDTAVVYDASNGEELHHYDLNSPIIYGLNLNEKEPVPLFITASGCHTSALPAFSNDKNGVDLFKHFSDDLCDAMVSQGIYTVKSGSNQIIYYGVYVYDQEWKSYKDAPAIKSYYSTYLDDDIAAIMDVQNNNIIIDFYNPSDKSFITSAKIIDGNKGPEYNGPQILGSYKDNLIICHENYDKDNVVIGATIYYVDSKTGNIESNYYDVDAINDPRLITYQDGKLLYTKIDPDNNYVVIQDIETHTEKQYLLPPTSSKNDLYMIKKLALNEDLGYIYCSGVISHYNGFNGKEYDPASTNVLQFFDDLFTDTPKEYIININYTEPKIIPVQMNELRAGSEYAQINDSGERIATTDGHIISIISNEGENLANISIQDKAILGFSFYNEPSKERELLIVPYSDGTICRYDVNTGDLIYKNTYTSSFYDSSLMASDFLNIPLYSATFTFDTEHSCMYLHNSLLTDIFDLNTFTELGCVKNSLGYHAPTDTFPVASEDSELECHLGYFKHYTLDDLIRKAKEILGDHEMPKEQKDAYGI